MSAPEELQYTRNHEWVSRDGELATVGITSHAQDELGDVVFLELPSEGDTFSAGDTLATIESVKAVSDVYAPMGGEVAEVNGSLQDNPEKVNEDPYGEGWLVRLRVSEEGDLLSAADYEQVLQEE